MATRSTRPTLGATLVAALLVLPACGDGGVAHLIFHAWDASKVGYAAGGYRQVVTSKLAVVDGVPVTQK